MSFLIVFRLIRMVNLLITAITGLIILYINPWVIQFSPSQNFILHSLFLILLMISQGAAGNIINDYYDVDVDEINKPSKVIAGKILSQSTILRWYFLFSIIGLICAIILTVQLNRMFYLIVAISYQVLLFLYSKNLQKMPFIGNLLIAFLVAGVVPISFSLVAFYWAESLVHVKYSYLLIGAFTYAFVVNLLRELVKDTLDVNGDGANGYRTIPILYGNAMVKKLMVLGNGLLMMISVYICIVSVIQFNWMTTLSALLFILAPTILFLKWSLSQDVQKVVTKLGNGLKIYLILGMIFYMLFSLSLNL